MRTPKNADTPQASEKRQPGTDLAARRQQGDRVSAGREQARPAQGTSARRSPTARSFLPRTGKQTQIMNDGAQIELVLDERGGCSNRGDSDRSDQMAHGELHLIDSSLAERPAGRNARTRMIKPNTTISRHCACQRPTPDSRTPRMKPP